MSSMAELRRWYANVDNERSLFFSGRANGRWSETFLISWLVGLEVSSLKQLWNGQAVMLMLILLACCNYAMCGVLDTHPTLM